MRKKLSIFICLIFVFSLLTPFASAIKVKADVANPLDYFVSRSFENASNDGFVARGQAVTISSVYEAAYEGLSSLKIQNRTSGWDGCELNLTTELSSGVNYQVSTYVYQTSSIPQPFKIIAIIQDDNGERFQTVAETVAVPFYWKKISGTLNFSYTGTLQKLSLIIISPNDTTFSYYVDKFEIAGPNKVGTPGLIVNSTFESATKEGWQPRGTGVSIDVYNMPAHTGNYSLFVRGRSSSWHGAQIDLLNIVQKGKTYTISGWVYQDSGSNQQITLTMQNRYDNQLDANGNPKYNYTSIVYQKTVPSNTWVELSGTFTVSATANIINAMTLYFESPNVNLSFYIDDVTVLDQNAVFYTPEWEIPSLFDQYKDYFKIGVAIPYKVLTNPTEMQMVSKHFNSITAENEMKPDAIQKTEGNFDFSKADEYVNYVQANNKVIRGHTLVWHQQVPNWFFYESDGKTLVSKDTLLQRMKTHIQTIVSRYKGKVYAWDVVNEAIDPSQPDGYRRSNWYNIAGPEYIEKAFIYAHEADPDAKLFYNDYNTEDPKKRQFIYEMVKSLKEKGVPIDGIGLQCHINIDSPTVSEIEKTIQLFSSIPGIEIHITELDMSVYSDSSTNYATPPSEVLIKQAYRYKEIFDMLKKYKNVVTNVTFWGLKDDYSWLNSSRNNYPLLFDKNYQSKYAYWAIVSPNVLPPLIQKASANNSPAIIDGLEDKEYKTVKPISIVANGQEIGTAKVLWNNGELYVFTKVYDSSYDANDQIKIFIDQNNAKSPYLQSDDIIVNINRFGSLSSNIQGIIKGSIVREISGGYTVEICVRLPNIVMSSNTQIGFDIAIINNNIVYNWNDSTSQQSFDTSKYGILVLGDKVKLATAKKGTPTIDGEEDSIWAKAEEISTDTVVSGSVYGAKAKVKVLWDENKLYVFARVYDPILNSANANAWERDSIEIFVDENNGKSTSYQDDDAQFRVNYNNEQSFGTGALANNFYTVSKVVYKDGNVDGYIVEAAVYAKTIKFSNGLIIGFDVQVNDADNSGKRVNVLTWSDPVGNDYKDTSRFGCLELVDETPVQQAPSSQNTSTTPTTTNITTNTSTTLATTENKDQATQQAERKDTVQTQQKQEITVDLKKGISKAVTVEKQNIIDVPKVAQIIIPQNALLSNGIIIVKQVEKETLPLQELNAATQPIEITTTTKIKGNIEIKFEIDKSKLAQDKVPVVMKLTKNGWQIARTKVDSSGNVSAITTEGGKYVVVADSIDNIFKDMKDHWAKDAAKDLLTKGIMVGFTDKTFRPDEKVNMSETLVMLSRALNWTPPAEQDQKAEKLPVWAKDALINAINSGVISEDMLSNPTRKLSRLETIEIIVKAAEKLLPTVDKKALNFTDMDKIPSDKLEYVEKAVALNLINGYSDGSFKPNDPISRAEAGIIISKLLSSIQNNLK